MMDMAKLDSPEENSPAQQRSFSSPPSLGRRRLPPLMNKFVVRGLTVV